MQIAFNLLSLPFSSKPMAIVFTSSPETYSKENTKSYTPNYYVLVYLDISERNLSHMHAQ